MENICEYCDLDAAKINIEVPCGPRERNNRCRCCGLVVLNELEGARPRVKAPEPVSGPILEEEPHE